MISVAALVALLYCWCVLAPTAKGQEPNCPYLQYLNYGGEYIGKITLPITQSVTDLNVKFSQRNPILSNYYGSLTLFDDDETTKSNIRNGRPVSYRVNFPTAGVLPRLVWLQLNGAVICSGSDYPPPSTMINLSHTLRSSTIVYNPFNNASPSGTFWQPQRQPLVQPVQNEIVPQNFGVQTTFYEPSPQQRPTITRPTTMRLRPRPQQQPQQQPQLQPQPQPQTQKQTYLQPSQPYQPPQPPQTSQPYQPPQQSPPPQQLPPPQQPPPPQEPSPPQPPEPQPQQQQSQTTVQPPQSTSITINISCGHEGNNITPFIHYGNTLARGQMPWLTAIYEKQTGIGLKFICGGSLVSRRTVITAAHCFKLTGLAANRVLIYLGRHNLDDYSEKGIEAHEVAELQSHPQYNTNTFPDADIALVQLQVPVEYTNWIQPICLWSERYDLTLPPRMRGYVAGWGGDESGSFITNLPKMVDAEIVSEADCLRSLEVQDFSSNRTLCAGNRDGSGPCMGDSGGGLMLRYNGVWVLRGIVSAGQVMEQHCNLHQYVIYCDVAKHITWVRENMKN